MYGRVHINWYDCCILDWCEKTVSSKKLVGSKIYSVEKGFRRHIGLNSDKFFLLILLM